MTFMLVLGIGTTVISSLIYIIRWPVFGSNPKGALLQKLKKSPQYDHNLSSFTNVHQDEIDKMYSQISYWEMFNRFFFGREIRRPNHKLPDTKPDLNSFIAPSQEIKFIWLGHSTFLVNLEGKILLFDPIFSNSIAPISFFAQRYQAPTVALDELPPIDFIVISHDHFDHLDVDSIKFFKNSKTKFISPLGVSSHLIKWGIESNRISELDWWESINFDNLEFICTPAQHFSGRVTGKENKTLWASMVIRTKTQNIYYSGDSGYGAHFKEIGNKYGPFDVTFIENGQYDEKWYAVHMLPAESAQAYLDLKGKNYVPVHWGMFELAFHNWFDPIVEIEKLASEKGIKLLTPKIGEIVEINSNRTFEKWWEEFLPKN